MENERFTTDLREPSSKWLPANLVKFGDAMGKHLRPIMPHASNGCLNRALASCVISVMGKDAHNDEGEALRSQGNPRGGRWIHTRLVTEYDHIESSRFRKTPMGQTSYGESFDAADLILGCFGLTMEQVLDHFGGVADTERKIFDIFTIVKALCPEILPSELQPADAFVEVA